ncbi:MAG: aldehyde dehydrogenase family protein, partial [Candidatus Limnocylindrales bacterium]
MTTATGAKPHPIFLAGTWVESDDPLIIANPADAANPAGSTFHATEAQYEQAVEAAVKAFEVTRHLPAYERGAILRNISTGIRARREELGRLLSLEAGKPIRDALVEVDRAVVTFRLG